MLVFHVWWAGLVLWCIDAWRRELSLRKATPISLFEMCIVMIAGIVWPVLAGFWMYEKCVEEKRQR